MAKKQLFSWYEGGKKGETNMQRQIWLVITAMLVQLCLTASALFLSACSVGMAMSGHPDPNIGVLSIGQSRDIVLLNLGQPSQTLATESGRTDVFRLQRGNRQSTGRAVGHAVMDLLTLGIWEVVGTPIEGFTGEEFTLTIEYDPEDKVKKITTSPGHSAF